MMYLAVKFFVHRDLAARNVLVSENGVCKVNEYKPCVPAFSLNWAMVPHKANNYHVRHKKIIPHIVTATMFKYNIST